MICKKTEVASILQDYKHKFAQTQKARLAPGSSISIIEIIF